MSTSLRDGSGRGERNRALTLFRGAKMRVVASSRRPSTPLRDGRRGVGIALRDDFFKLAARYHFARWLQHQRAQHSAAAMPTVGAGCDFVSTRRCQVTLRQVSDGNELFEMIAALTSRAAAGTRVYARRQHRSINGRCSQQVTGEE